MTPLILAFSLTLASDGAVRAVVDRAEALRRAGRLDDALRVLDAGASSNAKVSDSDRLRLRLARARVTYYRGSLAGTRQTPSSWSSRASWRTRPRWGTRRCSPMHATSSVSRCTRATFVPRTGQKRAPCSSRRSQRAGPRTTAVRSRSRSSTSGSPGRTRRTDAGGPGARPRAARGIARARRGGRVRRRASYAVRHLAGHKQDAGALDGALAGFEKSLALRQKAGYLIYVAPSLMVIGDVWKDKGDAARARGYYERARAEADRIGAARFRQMAEAALAAPPTR